MCVAIIPARGGSKGIPSKNLQKVGSNPLIIRTILTALSCSRVSTVFVSTDSSQIATISESYGAKIIIRPKQLGSDYASSEDVLLHSLGCIAERNLLSNKFVFLQCTSPFLSSEDLEKVVDGVDEIYNSSFSAYPWHGFLWSEQGRGLNHDELKTRKRRHGSQSDQQTLYLPTTTTIHSSNRHTYVIYW